MMETEGEDDGQDGSELRSAMPWVDKVDVHTSKTAPDVAVKSSS
jgi:hypothetical protein